MAGEEGAGKRGAEAAGWAGWGGSRDTRGTGQGSSYLRPRSALPGRRTPDEARPGSRRLPAPARQPSSFVRSLPPGLLPLRSRASPAQPAARWSAAPRGSRLPGSSACEPGVREPLAGLGVGGGEGGAGKLDRGDLAGEGQGRSGEGGGEEDGGERASLEKRLVSCPHPVPFFQHE